MSKYRNILAKSVINLIIILTISLCWVFPANAVTQELQLNGKTGYWVTTTFSYDEILTPTSFSEQGTGTTKALNSLKVSFYKPSGELIASYDNVVDGVATGNYFEFNFDPTTQKLLGNIDLGGETAGEIYLKGKIDQELALITVEQSGEEVVLDRISN